MSYDVKYIGMDVHKEAIVIAVLNGSGKLIMETILETKASSILQFIHGLGGELHVTWEEGTFLGGPLFAGYIIPRIDNMHRSKIHYGRANRSRHHPVVRLRDSGFNVLTRGAIS